MKFNPKLGFIILTDGLIDTGHYTCTPKNPSITNEAETIVFFLNVTPKRELEKGNVTSPLVVFFNGLITGDSIGVGVNVGDVADNNLKIENLVKLTTQSTQLIATNKFPGPLTDYLSASTTFFTNKNYSPRNNMEMTTDSSNNIQTASPSFPRECFYFWSATNVST